MSAMLNSRVVLQGHAQHCSNCRQLVQNHNILITRTTNTHSLSVHKRGMQCSIHTVGVLKLNSAF